MADVKKMQEDGVNTEAKKAEEAGKDKETKMSFKEKHPKMAKAASGAWDSIKWIAKGSLKIGLGAAAGYGIIKAMKKPIYVELGVNQTPQIDATEGVDFVPAPETEVQEA